MKTIRTTDGYDVKVSDEDYPELSKYSWNTKGKDGNRYAYRMVTMSRAIMDINDKSVIVDHINGNPLDNQKTNLRPASRGQNAWNCRLSRKNEAGFRGVYRNGTQWQARLKIDGKLKELGTYDTPEEAYKVWKKEAQQIRQEFYTG